jgi:hypothetical protein
MRGTAMPPHNFFLKFLGENLFLCVIFLVVIMDKTIISSKMGDSSNLSFAGREIDAVFLLVNSFFIKALRSI